MTCMKSLCQMFLIMIFCFKFLSINPTKKTKTNNTSNKELQSVHPNPDTTNFSVPFVHHGQPEHCSFKSVTKYTVLLPLILLLHQTCIHLQLKQSPANRLRTLIRVKFAKDYSAQLFQENMCFLNEIIFATHFKTFFFFFKFFFTSLDCWFWSFHTMC